MLPKCYLCESVDTQIIESGIRYDPDGKIYECLDCGLVFLWPIPSDSELATYYSSQYRKESGNKDVGSRFNKNLWEAGERVKRLDFDNVHSLLEIGSGSGAFLKTLRDAQRGLSITGVEPDNNSSNWIMSRLHFPVFNSIQSLPTLHKYDLIVLFHVLEHIGDPVEFLSRLRALLSPGGKIVVEVPSENDIMLRNVAYRKSYFFQKAHIFYFNAASVFDVALEAGLGCRIKPIQRYNLLNHIRWIVLKRNRGDGYYRDLRKSFIGKIYAKLLTVFGVSDTLWVEMESN